MEAVGYVPPEIQQGLQPTQQEIKAPSTKEQTTNNELPPGYQMHTWVNTDGKTELSDETLEKLQLAWAKSYIQSQESAQSNDPKYDLKDPMARLERIEHIKKELSKQRAALVYIAFENPTSKQTEIIGFFWGLPFRELKAEDPSKAQAVQEVSDTYTKVNELPPIEWDSTDYLSMMGVVSKSDDQTEPHTGKGFGRILTTALINEFKLLRDTYVVARTINMNAWDSVYSRRHFTLYGQLPDPKTKTTRLIFGRKIMHEADPEIGRRL